MTQKNKPEGRLELDMEESFRRARTAIDAVRRDLEELRDRAHVLVKTKAADPNRGGRVRPAK